MWASAWLSFGYGGNTLFSHLLIGSISGPPISGPIPHFQACPRVDLFHVYKPVQEWTCSTLLILTISGPIPHFHLSMIPFSIYIYPASTMPRH